MLRTSASETEPVVAGMATTETSEINQPITTSVTSSQLESQADNKVEKPAMCPNEDCEDEIPINPGTELAGLLKQYRLLRKTEQHTPEVLRLEMLICIEVTKQKQKVTCLSLVASKAWPTSIDFPALPSRVVAMWP
jgi:hypothetical protein